MTTIIERLAASLAGVYAGADDLDAKGLIDQMEVHGLTVMDRAEVEAAERHLRAIQAELRARAGVDV
jgi:hypothetical protein